MKKKKNSSEDIDDGEKKSTYAFLIVFGVIITFIVLIIILPKFMNDEPVPDDSYEYNYFDFIKVDGTWYTTTQENGNELKVSLRHGPKELEDIRVVGNITKFKENFDFVYVTFDPREDFHDEYVTMAVTEVSTNLVAHFGKDISAGCSFYDDICNETDTPIITCENNDKGVVYMNRVNKTSVIIFKNKCALINGMGEEMVRAADRLLYGMYGIMK